MTRRTDFRKANTYTGQKIKGLVDIAYKIDGVRILHRNGKFVTRNDKVPPGLKALTTRAKDKIREYGDCEVFCGSFFESNSPLSRHDPEPNTIDEHNIYPLAWGAVDAHFDQRLHIISVYDPTPEQVDVHLKKAVQLGYEGLVLRTTDRWYRVKPEATADVYVTGWFEQLDKNKNPKGQLGGFDTAYGKVTAFTEEMRQKLWDNPEQYVGQMITVTYKERYHTGKFRYATTFSHFRTDKNEETFDTEPPLK